MNKKIFFIASLLFLIVVLGVYLVFAGQKSPESEVKTYTKEESLGIAKNWVETEAPTYVYDGSDLEFNESRQLDLNDCQYCYEFEFSFESSHGGFGDRQGQMVTQVITPHLITLKVENGEVIKAVTDGKFNEITEGMIDQSSQGLQPQKVNLYYYNQLEDEDEEDQVLCSPDSVLPVSRIIPGQEPVEETLKLLLQGKITPQEEEQGFSTEFPEPGFELEDWQLENGVLTLTFTEIFGFTSGGACRVTLLRSQVEKTALQFPEVTEVVIQPESIFQP